MRKNKKLSENSLREVLNRSPHLDKEWLYNKYVTEGLSTYQIAELVGRNPKNIYCKLKDFGIPTRTKAETLKKNSWWALGKESALIGRHLTAEEKHKISEARTGKHYPKLSGKNNGMFGKRSTNWKGGTTPERQKLYGSLEWKELVKFIFERDNYICKRCGKTSRNLHAHHIKSWATCSDDRQNTNNMITV